VAAVSQSVNIRALQWAYERTGLTATEKAVLISFAIHADKQGYSFPSVSHISHTFVLDRRTVRRAIRALLVRHSLRPTTKSYGKTGQVKVYRLPKITWESGGEMHPFKKHQRGHKAGHKWGISGGEMTPNNEYDEQGTKHHSELMTLGTSVPVAPKKASSSSKEVFKGHHHQNQSAREHPKWPEFVAYCASQEGKPVKNSRGRTHDGIPTEDGFWKWLLGQKEQWRNKVKPADIPGQTLDGKFYTQDQAIQMGKENPELITSFIPAIKKRDGTIQTR
jgi:helix-turn-helix protein